MPLRRGDEGEAVADLQRRLTALGWDLAPDPFGAFGDGTDAAVRAFQARRGLRVDGVCGRQTWSALVEAGYRLGDRLLYHRSPPLRGDDVAELQRRLGALGFDAGRVDGILGERTAAALTEFQRNAGLTADGICGPATLTALARLGDRIAVSHGVAGVREREELRHAPRSLEGRRVAVGQPGGVAALADVVSRALGARGAQVLVMHEPDGSAQAAQANRFAAEVYLGLAGSTEGCGAAYYATEGFESAGGRRLAERAAAEVVAVLRGGPCPIRGMTLPVLRETKMPAVVCELGPLETVVHLGAEIGEALARAVATWAESPVEV